jgi:hypothetical protein
MMSLKVEIACGWTSESDPVVMHKFPKIFYPAVGGKERSAVIIKIKEASWVVNLKLEIFIADTKPFSQNSIRGCMPSPKRQFGNTILYSRVRYAQTKVGAWSISHHLREGLFDAHTWKSSTK